MPTKTPRERFEEEFWYIFDTNDMSAKPINEKLWSHIETLLEEARHDMKNKILVKIQERDDEWNNEIDADFEEFISSL